MRFRFLANAEAQEMEDEGEPTAVTHLFEVLDEKLRRSKKKMDDACKKADELGSRITPETVPKLRTSLSSRPPPKEPGTSD